MFKKKKTKQKRRGDLSLPDTELVSFLLLSLSGLCHSCSWCPEVGIGLIEGWYFLQKALPWIFSAYPLTWSPHLAITLLLGFCCNRKSRGTSLGTVSLLCPGGDCHPQHSVRCLVSQQGHWWPGLGKADVYPSPDLWAAVDFMDHLLLPKTASWSLLWVSSVSLAPLPPPVLGPHLLSCRYLLACLRLLPLVFIHTFSLDDISKYMTLSTTPALRFLTRFSSPGLSPEHQPQVRRCFPDVSAGKLQPHPDWQSIFSSHSLPLSPQDFFIILTLLFSQLSRLFLFNPLKPSFSTVYGATLIVPASQPQFLNL